jgi:trehalose 6-phosphate phosphatase
MKDILANPHNEVLAQIAWARVLLAFDFDGTLAPIVEHPTDARMRERTRLLFERVCALYPCAVISGRARDDVSRRIAGAPVCHVIGNHGLECGDDVESFARQIQQIRPTLERGLAGRPGIEIEDKGYSLAIHYRRSRQKRADRKAIQDCVRALPSRLRLMAGKLVVNVIPEGAPHKGEALLRVRAEVGADTALYVGDDITDEDVFEIDQPGRLLTVRVGRSSATSAEYFVRDQREVDRLLARLADLRESGGMR